MIAYDDGAELAPQMPQIQTAGVIHFATGWHVYFNGEVSAETYADRTAAIDELAKRDRAAKFCEQA